MIFVCFYGRVQLPVGQLVVFLVELLHPEQLIHDVVALGGQQHALRVVGQTQPVRCRPGKGRSYKSPDIE